MMNVNKYNLFSRRRRLPPRRPNGGFREKENQQLSTLPDYE